MTLHCHALSALLFVGAVAACSDTPTPGAVDGGTDTGARDAAAPEVLPTATLSMQAGIGEPGVFRSAPRDGSPLELQRGCQGAQHIFTSIRVVHAKGELGRVSIQVVRAADGAMVSVPLDLRLPLEADDVSPLARRITGLTPVIEVPRDVLDQVVEVKVRFEDAEGHSATSSFQGPVVWGPDSCGGH
jgi:hypothetical protein